MVGSRALASAALVVSLNLVFLTLVTSTSAPVPISPPPPPSNCPKLDACLDLLDLLNLSTGGRPPSSCCTIIQGLADLDAALCLCAALQDKAPGTDLNVPLTLDLLINGCNGNNVSSGLDCTPPIAQLRLPPPKTPPPATPAPPTPSPAPPTNSLTLPPPPPKTPSPSPPPPPTCPTLGVCVNVPDL